jgi:hypothetical protein
MPSSFNVILAEGGKKDRGRFPRFIFNHFILITS